MSDGSFMRSSTTRKIQLLLAFAALLSLALSLGCRGFFVNPTLSSIAVGPQTPTIPEGTSKQMTATGTYSDGSTKDLTGRADWNSSAPACAPISAAGVITAPQVVSNICTTEITASFGTITSPSTTATVTPGTPTSITLTASPTTPAPASTVTFTAKAIFPGSSTPQGITTSVTWINSDTTNLTLTNGSGTGTVSANAPLGTPINVSASFSGVDSNTVTLTVTAQ